MLIQPYCLGVQFMNIKDTITTMESKLEEIDALFDASQEAEKAGERFKAHGIAKDAEKIADEFEKLVHEMDDSDLDELLQEESQAQIQDTVEFLSSAAVALNDLVRDYADANKSGNQIEARRKLKAIQRLGNEIAHVTERGFD